MEKRVTFANKPLALLFVAPQIIITLVLFIWPAFDAIKESLFRGDAFGIMSRFVWFSNFKELFTNHDYLQSLLITLIFSFCVTILTLVSGLVVAQLVNNITKGKSVYKTLFLWPYAVAPAVAGIIFRFLFNPAIGVLTSVMNHLGYHWNFMLNGHQALALVILASSWQQFSYNFLFFFAGLQMIPTSIIEAAAIDGAGSVRRFFDIILPFLSPITFFLFVINLVYAFFDTFGVIQTVTQGGPANATNTLVFKVYQDGFVGLNIGGSAAQSVVLMCIIIGLTVLQFKFIERKVHY